LASEAQTRTTAGTALRAAATRSRSDKSSATFSCGVQHNGNVRDQRQRRASAFKQPIQGTPALRTATRANLRWQCCSLGCCSYSCFSVVLFTLHAVIIENCILF
jgi:hypothetical protein